MPPYPPFTPRAVVFDLDGVLVDSEPVWAAAERDVVESYGRPWDPAVHRLLLGSGPAEAAALLAEHLGLADLAAVDRRLSAAVAARFRAGVPLRPGAAELVRALHGRLRLGVATNSRRLVAGLALHGSGLGAAMRAVVCAEDVEHAKPAHDPYTTACGALGVDPGAAVAFEDSPVGVRSARAAGMWVIGCPAVAGVALPEADAVVGSLLEIDPAALAAGDAAEASASGRRPGHG